MPEKANPPSTLVRIAEAVRLRVAARKSLLSPQAMAEAVRKVQRQPRDFRQAFTAKKLNIIAEIKFASPSQGRIVSGLSPVDVATAYLQSGASALSILTEEDFFQGHGDYLKAVRAAHEDALLLQKDFILEPYQIEEAFCAGADAVLIIVALVGEQGASRLLDVVRQLGLHALVEVHTRDELDIAKRIGADIIGINNRSLIDLSISLDVTRELRPLCPPGATVICESGLSTRSQLEEMAALGCHGFLVGTSLMRSGHPGLALQKLLAQKGDGECG